MKLIKDQSNRRFDKKIIEPISTEIDTIVALTQSWKCCKCRHENYYDKWDCSDCHHARCNN